MDYPKGTTPKTHRLAVSVLSMDYPNPNHFLGVVHGLGVSILSITFSLDFLKRAMALGAFWLHFFFWLLRPLSVCFLRKQIPLNFRLATLGIVLFQKESFASKSFRALGGIILEINTWVWCSQEIIPSVSSRTTASS